MLRKLFLGVILCTCLCLLRASVWLQRWCSWSSSPDICLLGVRRVLCSVIICQTAQRQCCTFIHLLLMGLSLDSWVKDFLFLFSDLYKNFWPLPVSFGKSIRKGILVIYFLLMWNGFRIFKKFCCFKIQLPHFIIKTYCNKFLEYLLWGNYVWYVNIWSFWSFAHMTVCPHGP